VVNETTDSRKRTPLWRNRLVHRVLRSAVTMYVLWCVLVFCVQDWVIFPRHRALDPPEHPPIFVETQLTIKLDGGGDVFAWFIPALGATAENPAPVVIFFHGNGEVVGYEDEIILGYRTMGVSVLLPEYRGYGPAAGRPSEKGILDDAVRFYDELVKRPDVDASHVVFHGRSLGGGFAAGLAARREPCALILESTFTSVVSMAGKYLVPAFLVRHPMRIDRVLRTIKVPVLIFHGTRDRIIPVSHGRKLKALVPDATYIEYDRGHIDLTGHEGYWREVQHLLEAAGALKQE